MKIDTPDIHSSRLAAAFAGFLLILGAIAVPGQDAARFDEPLRVCARISSERTDFPLFASDNDNANILLASLPHLRKYSINGLRNSWTTDSGGRIVGSPGYLPDGTAFGLFESGDSFVLRHFSGESGLSREIRRFPKMEFSAAGSIDGILLLKSVEGGVTAVSSLTGSRIWTTTQPDLSIADGVAAGAARILLKRDSGFAVVRLSDGNVEGELPAADYVRVFGGDDDAGIFALAGNGDFVLVDPENGDARWRFRTGGTVTGAVGAGTSVLFGSTDNFVYKLNLRRGTVDWKSRIGDRVLDPPIVSSGYFFVPNRLRMTVEIHSLGTGKPVNSLPVDDGMRILAVAPGADGSVAVVTTQTVYSFAKSCSE